MHEFSIAVQIVSELEALATEHGASRVSALTILAGEIKQIVPDALITAFEAASADTPADGAVLHLETKRIRVRCCECGHEYGPEDGSYICPECNCVDVDVIEGDELLLSSVEFEME